MGQPKKLTYQERMQKKALKPQLENIQSVQEKMIFLQQKIKECANEQDIAKKLALSKDYMKIVGNIRNIMASLPSDIPSVMELKQKSNKLIRKAQSEAITPLQPY